MDYIELKCRLKPRFPAADILISMLSDMGYESFVDDEEGFKAYIPQPFFDNNKIKTINLSQLPEISFVFTHQLIKERNWNEVWEKNYKALSIGKYFIRAPFHEPGDDIENEIIISPKMSFGTGHHETTYMMVQLLEEFNIKKKSFLDLGCGTGILAIIAVKERASHVTAVDIDRWAVENTLENLELNKITGVKVLEGDIKIIADQKFDVITANIHLNVLVNDMKYLSMMLNQDGCIIVSGIYEKDLPELLKSAGAYGLKLRCQKSKNKWVALSLINQ